jgi:Tfp pilus assembly protein PilO
VEFSAMSLRALRDSFRASPPAGVVPVDAGERLGSADAARSRRRSPAPGHGRGALIRERAGRAVLRAGWPGIVGVVLVVLASVVGYAGRLATDERRVELADERVRLLRGEDRAAPVVSDGERLEAFYGRFPRVAELPASLRRLHEHASAHGVDLQRTDYRSATVAGTPLVQVTLSIPVEGGFGPLYEWLADLLREMPEVALESLSVERAATDTDTVAAELRLQLYLRGRL